jgi:hypothetical protein
MLVALGTARNATNPGRQTTHGSNWDSGRTLDAAFAYYFFGLRVLLCEILWMPQETEQQKHLTPFSGFLNENT